jgi:hypothetical protein
MPPSTHKDQRPNPGASGGGLLCGSGPPVASGPRQQTELVVVVGAGQSDDREPFCLK